MTHNVFGGTLNLTQPTAAAVNVPGVCCTAGLYDLCPSESQPNESLRVQLAGATAPHKTDAWAAVRRTWQSNLNDRSPPDVKARRWFCRLCKVTIVCIIGLYNMWPASAVQFTSQIDSIRFPNWFEGTRFENVLKSDSVFWHQEAFVFLDTIFV